MNLHRDKNAFRVLLEDIHKRTGVRTDVLEKDYYVVLFLRELAALQDKGLPAFFKGGTALYKALKTTRRFSEDIDLSVDTEGCTRTQSDKRLENASKKFSSLPRERTLGFTHRSEVMAVYQYEPVTAYDSEDELQRFGKLKVEATSFTIATPVKAMEVSAEIYGCATPEQKRILEEQYDIHPFSVQTITLERIFTDKLFAAEAYSRRSGEPHRAFEAAKHIYDLAVLETQPAILSLMQSDTELEKLLQIRLEEETRRHDGIPNLSPRDFCFFETVLTDEAIRTAYNIMQKQYVFREQDRIPFEKATAAISRIFSHLSANPAWQNAVSPQKDSE